MKTPDEIKKGLECCIEGRCSKCPYEQVCDKHMADGGDTIPTAEPLADFLTLVQQLERERDAAVEDLTLIANDTGSCIMCKHRIHPGYVCDRFEREENCYEWRGVQKEVE